MQQKRLSGNINRDLTLFRQILCPEKNFDLVERLITIGGRDGFMYQINGFTDEDALQKIIQFYLGLKPGDMPDEAGRFCRAATAYADATLSENVTDMITAVLSGLAILVVDGYTEGIIFDVRDYPGRGIEEPEKDKVLRGSRDGFGENIINNTALIRRRIRSPKLCMELVRIGRVSHTDVALVYMDDRVDRALLEKLRGRLTRVQVDSLTMNQQSLAECLYKAPLFNPFPKFKYSERPDVACASLLEGNLVLLTDNSPSSLILPSSLFDIVEEADDYYFPPLTGTYLRTTRVLIALIALLLTPVYILLMNHTELLPEALRFIIPKEVINVPLFLQILILELAVDGLRLAAVNTPNMLSTPLSIIAGIVLGDFAIQSGWFNAEIMVYMAFVTMANFSQTSYELAYAFKFIRILLLILTAAFDVAGFAAGLVIGACALIFNKTIGGTPYLYPLIPLRPAALRNLFVRRRLRCSYRDEDKSP